MALLVLAGCDSGPKGPSDQGAASSAPAIPATEPEGLPISELRRRLGADRSARFIRTGGEITAAELYGSGATDLTPLRGLPLRRLGISGLRVRDLTPLAGMPLEELTAEETLVEDLSSLKGLPLRRLYLRNTNVADLSPLKGMPIEQLNVVGTPVTDIATVRDMPLETLWIASTGVRSLAPLVGKPLVSLDLENTPIDDLSVLATTRSLLRLNIAGSAVTDVTPLAGLRLERLIFTPAKIENGIQALREMPTLQTIGPSFDDLLPAEVFWTRFDAGAFSGRNQAASENVEASTFPMP